MRVALVNPPDRAAPELPLAPLGLAYITAFLRSHGRACDQFNFDTDSTPPRRLVDVYGLADYDVVAFATYTHTLPACLQMVDAIRKRRRQTTIVLGGYHVTSLPAETLEDYPDVDFVLRNEGERSMLDLLGALGGRHDLATVMNLGYRRNGAAVLNEARPPELDLDSLPWPARDFVNCGVQFPLFYDAASARERLILHVVSSRGCPYQCNYCSIPVSSGRKMRYRSTLNVTAELAHWKERCDFGHIFFSEPNFLVSHHRARELATAIHERWPELTFSFETRADQIVRFSDTIAHLARSGCSVINIGIESASPAVLKRINKGTSAEQNEAALALLPQLGVRALPYMIMFDPDSTLDDLHANIEFLERTGHYNTLPHHSTLYGRLEPLPGVPYRDYYLKEFGLPDRHALAPATFRDARVHAFYETIRQFRDAFDDAIAVALAEAGRLRSELTHLRGRDVALDRALQVFFLGSTSLIYIPYYFFKAALRLYRTSDLRVPLSPLEVDALDPAAARIRELERILAHSRRVVAAVRRLTHEPRPATLVSPTMAAADGLQLR